jgi:hypothetical protein
LPAVLAPGIDHYATAAVIIPARPGAGLRIEFRHEFDFDAFGRFESLRQQADGSYRLPPGRPRVPLIFSVRASLDRG